MSRPLMSAVAGQQAVLDQARQTIAVQAQQLQDQGRQLEVQGQQIAYIARLAGVTQDVEGIARQADIANPAQPIPDPGEQGPSETTEQAATPETNDDPRAPGQTGGSSEHVPAQATDVAIQPGGTIPTGPYNQLEDVTAPVSGTNTGEVGGDQTRIESDVRVGDPMDPSVAFPWTISDNQSNQGVPSEGEMSQTSDNPARGAAPRHASQGGRFAASLRLARLRIDAGAAQGDDVSMAAAIDADSSLSNEVIDHEIRALSSVMAGQRRQASAGTNGVPRRAASASRTAPSLASAPTLPTGGLQTTAAADDSLMFLSDGDLSGLG